MNTQEYPACHLWPSPIESPSPGFLTLPHLPVADEIPFPLTRAVLIVLCLVAQGRLVTL